MLLISFSVSTIAALLPALHFDGPCNKTAGRFPYINVNVSMLKCIFSSGGVIFFWKFLQIKTKMCDCFCWYFLWDTVIISIILRLICTKISFVYGRVTSPPSWLQKQHSVTFRLNFLRDIFLWIKSSAPYSRSRKKYSAGKGLKESK